MALSSDKINYRLWIALCEFRADSHILHVLSTPADARFNVHKLSMEHPLRLFKVARSIVENE